MKCSLRSHFQQSNGILKVLFLRLPQDTQHKVRAYLLTGSILKSQQPCAGIKLLAFRYTPSELGAS